MESTRILYNDRCPICRAEMRHYTRRAEAANASLVFVDVNSIDTAQWALTETQASRRLHAKLPDGQVISGIDAFAAIWDHLPGLRWMARTVRLPVVGAIFALLYDRVAAPLLYRMHLRRERLGNPTARP
ncbi:DUF393 domain-containing protein [Rhodobacteraceae bacterium M385]|nr:DUF393 domain-containing protein [Rhodobacteraceae bacterium M385]